MGKAFYIPASVLQGHAMYGSGDIERLLDGVIPVLGSLANGNAVCWDSFGGLGALCIIREYLNYGELDS